jgi:four helix bundle protein
MHRFEELVVWQKGMGFAEGVEIACARMRRTAIAGQLRRAAVSIPSNIAEGSQRGDKEFVHFLAIASGSAAEAETQLRIASGVGLMPRSVSAGLIRVAQELRWMLNALIRHHRGDERRAPYFSRAMKAESIPLTRSVIVMSGSTESAGVHPMSMLAYR